MDARTGTQIHTDLARNKKKYRRRHRHTRAGQCAAAVRATTAAKLYLAGQVPSVAAAALGCGAYVAYTRAAVILLQSENATMLERVLRGHIPLSTAAQQLKQVAALVDAYRAAAAVERVAFARAVGPTVLFDNMLVPAI
jgi:hypothetical protein